jgi:DNA-binding MarR family transcriptional regulator
MGTGAEELQRQLVDFIRAFGLHQPDRTACGQPISTSEAHALSVLAESGPVRISELAQELMLEKSTVSRIVASMTQRGWVRSTTDATDGRARLVGLTGPGRRAASRLKTARTTHLQAVLDAVDPIRRDEVVQGLAELARAARKLREDRADAVGA